MGLPRVDKRLSLYLDFLRGLAAVTVVFYHYSKSLERRRFELFPDVGQEAVIVFFVISGFVIAWVAHEREKTPALYALRRLARLWSVVLPSIIVALICYLWVSAWSPQDYHWKGVHEYLGLKSLLSALFLNWNVVVQWMFSDSYPKGIYLPGGGPYWSLVCEAWYYIIFGLAFYFRGLVTRVSILGVILFLGPGPILLFPLWILGVWLFYNQHRFVLPQSLWKLFYIGSIVGLVFVNLSSIRYRFLELPEVAFGIPIDHARYAPYFYLVGVLFAVHIMAFAHLRADAGISGVLVALQKPIRRLANVSFFLYLTHLPVMLLLRFLQGRDMPSYLLPLEAVMFALWVGPMFERSKGWYFDRMSSLAGRWRRSARVDAVTGA